MELKEEFNSLELKEHELFLINRIFKTKKQVVFEEYLKSKRFRVDFKAFDEMLNRSVERKSIFKNSKLKNINKILLLIVFAVLGINMFYSILLPITIWITGILSIDSNVAIIINMFISCIIHTMISYLYITYISRTTSMQENMNLRIAYIILSIILAIIIIFGNFRNAEILKEKMEWYIIGLNFVVGLVVLLYMFNIIKHDNEWLYWSFIGLSIIGIIFGLELLIYLCMMFFVTYIFFKSPKHISLKEDDYIYQWEGFKRFLEDYSILGEQEESAILIWDNYLIYAISLGINKQVIKKYGRLNKNILIDEKYFEKFYIQYLQ